MKFPYTLSKDRLSLLSEEDLRLYEYEHSPYYSYEDKMLCVNAFRKAGHRYMELIESDEEFKNLAESEKYEMADNLVRIETYKIINEIYNLIYPDIIDGLSEKEQEELKSILVESIYKLAKDDKMKPLNEDTPGHDLTFWIPGLGWLGKLATGLLTAGLAGIIGLIMAGKDKAAAKALEKYMNKLVESTDNGLYKKKSFFSWFSRDKTKFKGDQSYSCFRSIQEMYERKICTNTLVAGKAAGYFSDNPLQEAASQKLSGGLLDFKKNVVDSIDFLIK